MCQALTDLFSPHTDLWCVFLVSSFNRWWNWDTEKLSKLPEPSQSVVELRFESGLLGLEVLFLVLVLNCLHWFPTCFPMPCPYCLGWPWCSQTSSAADLAYHSPWLCTGLSEPQKVSLGTPPEFPRGSFNIGSSVCGLKTFLKINKSQSFILTMTQPRGEVLVIPLGEWGQRWLELYSQVAEEFLLFSINYRHESSV